MKRFNLLPRLSLRQLILLPVLLIIMQSAKAQTFQTDHMSRYEINGQEMQNNAIIKDENNGIFYIVQSIKYENWALLISEVDPDYNIIKTYRYDCNGSGPGDINQNMYLYPKDINFFGDQIIVVGAYIEEGVDRGGFMFSAEKSTGLFQWFNKYTDVYSLESVVCNDVIDGAITVGRSDAYYTSTHQYSITQTAGEIMRMDATGNVIWHKQMEDDKYVGHPDNWQQIFHSLSHVIQIGSMPNVYAAVGQVNNFINWTFPYLDGDATILTFDDNGNILSQLGLGNISPIYVNGSAQNNQHEAGYSIALCSDGDVIMAGYCADFPDTYITISCKGSDPNYAGLWLTKVNPTTGVVAWSKVYDMFGGPYSSPDYPQLGWMDIVNDGTDNFGVQYLDGGSGKLSIMKVDVTGAVQYSRRYDYDYQDPTNREGSFFDISSGIGNTDIYAIGYTGAINADYGDGWNVIAFDNIIDYCHSEDLPLVEYQHPYETFMVEYQMQNAMPTSVFFRDGAQILDHMIECEKMEIEEEDPSDGGKPARTKNNEPKVSSTVETGDILVEAPADKVYTGTLINSLGQKVQSFDNISNTYRISTNDLAPGIYYLHLTSGNEQFARPVLIK